MFRRILVANRGEIAIRIIRACKELDIESVAVYSTADSNSMHKELADKSICIGPPIVNKSYLNISNIIGAAEVTNCDAIHPGYGFLSENPKLVEKCKETDIVFIGPPVNSINLAGNKSEAIKVMRKNKIPVIPGSIGNVTNIREALKVCKRIGYPVILKASFGGGGKGMRICNSKKELRDYLPIAISESRSAFGTEEVYLEKYIPKPRHIEFQIVADNYGNIRCLGERECSIQRRHQKLIEEAPANNLSDRTRKQMAAMAIRAAESINYKNVGTIEFLVDQEENFYFIEMNTRIQVEHPVTEMVTGMDLVKEQIKMAAGEKINNNLKNYKINGKAIEFRINAEDPDNNFSPCPGRITDYFIPGGPGVRIDTYIHSNFNISPFYDSLLAKLIIWGNDRKEAIARSKRALEEFKVEGIKTTIPFHKKILDNKNFLLGNIHTHFIEEELGV